MPGTDPAMIALVNHEFADLPEEERRELARDLAGMDPKTAERMLRVARVARGQRGGGTRSTSDPMQRGAGVSNAGFDLAGGHSQGVGDGPRIQPGPGSARRNDDVALAGLGVDVWDDTPTGQPHTTRRPPVRAWPDEQPAAQPQPESRGFGAGAIGQLTNRMMGNQPAAVANTSPLNSNQPEVRLVGDTAPANGLAERPAAGVLRSGPDPDRPILPTDVPRDRTMSNAFDSEPPPHAERPVNHLAQHIDDLDRSLANSKPSDDPRERLAFVEQHVLLRMLYLANDQQERAFVPIPGLDPDEQEFWKNYLWATANYFDSEKIARSEDRAGQTVAQLREAIRTLQTKARLELRHVSFCEQITSFGDYQPIENPEFGAGKLVLVYAEVENFRSESTSEGDFRTMLNSSAEIYDAAGKLVGSEPIDFGRSEDRSRNHRRDFFLAYKFALPVLPPGNYTFKLAVDDELSGRTDTHSMNFSITH